MVCRAVPPCSWLISVACAPGITAPDESCTTPVIEPDVFCAESGELNANMLRTSEHAIAKILFVFECIGFLHWLAGSLSLQRLQLRFGAIRKWIPIDVEQHRDKLVITHHADGIHHRALAEFFHGGLERGVAHLLRV